MDFRQLVAAFQKLNETERHAMHVLTIANTESGALAIERFSKAVEWKDSKQRPLKDNSLRSVLKDLERKGLLTKAKNYENYSVPHFLQDYVIQDCVSTGSFKKLSTGPKAIPSYFYTSHDETLAVRGLRIAFYTGDATSFQERFRFKTARAARLLTPFNRSIYDRLPKAVRLLYLQGMVQQQIMGVSSTSEALQIFDDLNKEASGSEPLHLGSSLDLAIARGDLDTLKQLNEQTKSKSPEIEACCHFLKGDFEKAKRLFAKAMPLGKNSRKSSLAMERLPALLYLLVLFRENSHEATQMGYSLISACIKSDKNVYADVFGIIEAALNFQEMPMDTGILRRELANHSRTPLEALISSYFQRWLLTDNESPGNNGPLASVVRMFQSTGLFWLAAEARAMLPTEKPETADDKGPKHPKGTISLVNWIEPEPAWQRSLNAIAQVGSTQVSDPANRRRHAVGRIGSGGSSAACSPAAIPGGAEVGIIRETVWRRWPVFASGEGWRQRLRDTWRQATFRLPRPGRRKTPRE